MLKGKWQGGLPRKKTLKEREGKMNSYSDTEEEMEDKRKTSGKYVGNIYIMSTLSF